MKFKGHKFKLTTREEVADEFNKELNKRIEDHIWKEVGSNAGMFAFFTYKEKHSEKIRIDQKLQLLDEWERKGRNTAFSTESWGELIYKKYYGS